MLTRVFTFTADAKGRTDFRLAYESYRSRDPQKITKDERRHLAELQRELERISDPIGDLPDDVDMDLRQRKLKADGGFIALSQRTFEKLEGYIDEAPFMAGLSVQVEDFRDRLSAAEKVESE